MPKESVTISMNWKHSYMYYSVYAIDLSNILDFQTWGLSYKGFNFCKQTLKKGANDGSGEQEQLQSATESMRQTDLLRKLLVFGFRRILFSLKIAK